jgi:glycosyltransferase involved in cell wall biosynthesis
VRTGVVVPVHGWAPYLAEALDAILVQQPAPAEVVVVDDGSREPLALHPDHAPHVRLLRREQQGGVAAARATGEAALAADVDLVASCDADDAWLPGKLAAQLDVIGDAAMCFGAAIVVGADGRETGERWDVPAEPLTAQSLYVHNPIPVSSALVRRDVLHAAGGYGGAFGNYAEDWDLWLRLLRDGAQLVGVPDARIRYRRHPGGMTADVGAMARAQLALHRAHGDLVDARTRRRALARDARALARDRLRTAVRRAL